MGSEFGPCRVLVIGAGQAGFSAAGTLQLRGLDCAVLDGADDPGGAWRHRRKERADGTVKGIIDRPGIARPAVDPHGPSPEFGKHTKEAAGTVGIEHT